MIRTLASALAATTCIVALATPAAAQTQNYNIPSGSLKKALDAYVRASGRQIVYREDQIRQARSPGARGELSAEAALVALLAGSGFRAQRDGDLVAIVQSSSADGAAAEPASDEQGPTTSTIIVTARKREERAIDVPIALTVFGNEDLQDRGALDLADFIETAPGVNLTTDGVFQQLAIRGVATSLGGNANGYYLNNVPFTGVSVPWNPNVEAFDLERVEVLRGPQGTLFGEGSMGGTIRIITNSPQLDKFGVDADARVSTTRGGDDSYAVRGMVNIPIVKDMLAIRAVAIQENLGGWIDTLDGEENINDVNVTTFRGQLLFEPTERLSIEAGVWINDQVAEAGNTTLDSGFVPTDDQDSRVGYDQYSASIAYSFDNAEVRYSFGNNELENAISAALPGLGSLEGTINIEVQTHEFVAASTGSGAIGWTLGGYYRKADRADVLQLPALGIDGQSVSRSKVRALFGEIEYRLSPALRIAAGLRYFTEDLEGVETGIGFTGPINASASAEFDSFNPRVIVSYEPSDRNLIYVSASKGFRGGQLQPITSVQVASTLNIDLPPALGADTIWTYELGTKNTFLNGALTVEAALYKSDWSNPAVRFELERFPFIPAHSRMI